MMEIQYLGNKELLKLASGKHEGCVISGFSSKLEKECASFPIEV